MRINDKIREQAAEEAFKQVNNSIKWENLITFKYITEQEAKDIPEEERPALIQLVEKYLELNAYANKLADLATPLNKSQFLTPADKALNYAEIIKASRSAENFYLEFQKAVDEIVSPSSSLTL